MTAYRADLDGLRAVAVVLVVLHHAFPAAVPGGFIGVDVFFVLSGYLISGIILGELGRGRFSLLHFYERRARRILPALFVVLFATAAFAAVALLPGDLIRFCRTMIATVAFVSNAYFARSVDYFAPSAETNLLLHTWSLSVEEQFYLVFPLACVWLFHSGRRRAVALAVATVIGLTLAASAWATARHPQAAFYLAPVRAWELLLGAALVLHGRPVVAAGWRAEIASMSGLFLIVTATFLYSRHTPFPGLAALAPCLGAALLIGTGDQRTFVATRLLEARAPVYVGLISYSLYLWHWPLLAGLRYLEPEPGSAALVAVVVTAFVVAGLSLRYVERPFRRTGVNAIPTPRIWAGAATATVATIALAGGGIHLRGLPERHPELALPIPGREHYREGLCFLKRTQEPGEWGGDRCFLTTGESRNALLWGDSFAAHYAPGFAMEVGAVAENVLQFSLSSCPPSFHTVPDYPLCERFNARVDEILERFQIQTVFLAAQWRHHFSNGRISVEKLKETIARLRSQGRAVILIGQTPTVFFADPRQVMSRARLKRMQREAVVEPALPRHDVDALLQAADRDVIDPSAAICLSTRCTIAADGQWLFWDFGHLSVHGSRTLVRYIGTRLQRTVAPGRSTRRD